MFADGTAGELGAGVRTATGLGGTSGSGSDFSFLTEADVSGASVSDGTGTGGITTLAGGMDNSFNARLSVSSEGFRSGWTVLEEPRLAATGGNIETASALVHMA